LSDPGPQVVVGEVVGVYGIKGWVKIRSFTDPQDRIFDYGPWLLTGHGNQGMESKVRDGRRHGKGLIASLEGIEDRDRAAELVGCEVRVRRSELGEAAAGQYFWSDLEGLAVETDRGIGLGHIESLLETGANDVLVVTGERRRLIPFLPEQVVKSVDLESGRVIVDWDPDF
jgi:16S rRNA processing protein RimM